tara:strand:+ start:2635 stop:3345 length:711 start_codon:yes stop_codon:yes gene_type:complete
MIAISQPTYLPWIGYFNLIINSNKFIFLDDVQFDKRSWQQRNKIKSNLGEQIISVPVKTKGKRDQLLKDVVVDDQNFFKKHLKTIQTNYSKTKYFKKIFPLFESIEKEINKELHLSNINIILINLILEILNIKRKIILSSKLDITGEKTSKLINICNFLGDKKYLANPGAINYLEKDMNIINSNNIELYVLNYKDIKYQQYYNGFLSHLSIIDLLFNEGKDSVNILSSSFNIKKIN